MEYREAWWTTSRETSLGRVMPDITREEFLAIVNNPAFINKGRDMDPLIRRPSPDEVPKYAPPGGCDSECKACKFQYFSVEQQTKVDACAYERAVTDHEAATQLNEFVTGTRNDREWLRTKLETHGDN